MLAFLILLLHYGGKEHKGGIMQAFSIEESIVKGNMQVNDLFEFVQRHASEIEAYEMEQSVFSYVMKVGLTEPCSVILLPKARVMRGRS